MRNEEIVGITNNTDQVIIDRDGEDLLVRKYQNTNDKLILEQLYNIRKQTLQIWANKYSYLRTSEEDLLSEVGIIWLKCVNQYEYNPKARTVRTKSGKFVLSRNGEKKTVFKRTSFNTFLYTSLKNYMSNIFKWQHSRKRVDKEGRPQESRLLSIDYEYDKNNNDSTKVCLKDMLVSKAPGPESKSATDMMIEDISKGESDIKGALIRFTSDSHIKKISNACQNIAEQIKVRGRDVKIFMGHNGAAKKRLKTIIDESNKYPRGYRLLNFRFDDKNRVVIFEVKRRDTRVLRKTMWALKRYRHKLESE